MVSDCSDDPPSHLLRLAEAAEASVLLSMSARSEAKLSVQTSGCRMCAPCSSQKLLSQTFDLPLDTGEELTHRRKRVWMQCEFI